MCQSRKHNIGLATERHLTIFFSINVRALGKAKTGFQVSSRRSWWPPGRVNRVGVASPCSVRHSRRPQVRLEALSNFLLFSIRQWQTLHSLKITVCRSISEIRMFRQLGPVIYRYPY